MVFFDMIQELAVMSAIHEEMKTPIVFDVKLNAEYRKQGILYGYRVTFKAIENKIFPKRGDFCCFFKETWFRNSKRAALRFKNRLLSTFNENTK